MKKTDINLKAQLMPILNWLKKNHLFITIVGVLVIYSSLVTYMNILNRREPDEDTVTEQIQTVKKPTIKLEVIDKLTELEDNNVEIKALFKQARENPFQE